MDGFGSPRYSWAAFPSPDVPLRTPSPRFSPREEGCAEWKVHTPVKLVAKSHCSCVKGHRARRSNTGCSCPGCRNTAVREQRQSSGCTCKRSRCRKRYCECFSNSRRCGKACRCLNCFNALPPGEEALSALVDRLPPDVAKLLNGKLRL